LSIIKKLITDANVFLTNMRPQFLHRSGLDPQALLGAHPRLICASLTAYGLHGPDREAPGYDMAVFSGRSGLAERSTPPGGTPPIFPGGIGDNASALSLVAGIAGTLFRRERTGQRQLVSALLLRTGVYTLGMDISTRIGLGRITAPAPRTRPQNPLMNLYRAGDGRWFWLVGAEAQRHWPGIVAATEFAALQEDVRFASPRERHRNSTALVEALDHVFAQHSRDHLAAQVAAHDVWWAPIQPAEEVVSDPQALACGSFARAEGQTGEALE